MLGATEYVADALAEELTNYDLNSRIHLTPDLSELDPQATWLICTSTHGAGDFPDNIHAFTRQLPQASLNQIRYLLVGLGDSSYDTFCEAGKTMHRLMQAAGASSIVEPCYIDVLEHPIPEDEAVAWLNSHLQSPKFIQSLNLTGAGA
ncbi:nitric oxide synthase [Lacimicrobium alkaliphilum]|uniref:Nitric oxide synthase n=2 Tax=Lacimicrobium alkaliphilum TaxID=1526571 RepID=A0A0U2ZCC6_9ALTE|nr:nitric oxide synthase [Lacimicrobium alkaliphilum]